MHRPTAHEALQATDPDEKVRLARAAHAAQPVDAADADLDATWRIDVPGRPVRPPLVHPARVPRRGLATATGRAALIHAITHIEFNAINLALDASCRFAGMPAEYHADWLRIASEESLHFTLLRQHLRTLGHDYGDFEAHDGLWEMASATRDDVLARMALVPRILEARGLDVTPGLRDRLAAHGDLAAAKILERILRDEIGHVAVGNHWFAWLCQREGRSADAEFDRLLASFGVSAARPPLNREARLAAGFTPAQIDRWETARTSPTPASPTPSSP
jgi:uncharacterized ferritin-like protein (DUF455 family)